MARAGGAEAAGGESPPAQRRRKLTEEDRALAREGLRAKIPPGWRVCETDAGEIFYFNYDNGNSSWDHSADEQYRPLVALRRARRPSDCALAVAASSTTGA